MKRRDDIVSVNNKDIITPHTLCGLLKVVAEQLRTFIRNKG
jgi:hypothetical protein